MDMWSVECGVTNNDKVISEQHVSESISKCVTGGKEYLREKV